MLVAKFNCPACDAVLKPSAPVPSGKKIKCPRCARVIVVPAPQEEIEEPEEDEVEALEEVELERKRPRPRQESVQERPTRAARPRDEDEEEDRPRKSRSRRDADEEENDEDRPRKSRSRDEDEDDDRPRKSRSSRDDDDEDEDDRPRKKSKRPKKAKGGGAGLKIALFSVVGLLLLGGIGFGIYFLVSSVGGNPQQRAFEEATSILANVKDQASAQAARPALVAVGKRLNEIHVKQMAELKKGLDKLNEDPAAIQRAIDEAMRNPEKARAEAERREKERLPLKEAAAKLSKEAARVSKVPGGKELLETFWEAWGDEGKMMKLAVDLSGRF